jgi:CBS domain containing-hemolysin-like protein
MSDWASLGIAIFLVALNGFFVAAEFALVKVRATRIAELVSSGSPTARIAEREVQNLDAYLSATQLGITIASIGLGWVGEPAVEHLLKPLFTAVGWEPSSALRHSIIAVIAFLTITFMHIVFGELAPKSLAIQRPESTTLAVAWPLHVFYRVFYPAIVGLNGTAALILRLFGLGPASEHEIAHSQEEVRMILTASQRHGHLKENEVELMQNVIHFADKSVREIMVPRVDMIYLSTEWSLQKNIEVATQGAHSRYPVTSDGPDNIIGFARSQDLLPLAGQPDAPIDPIVRDILRVPETKPVDQLLREFQARRLHMALVIDEFGGTAGLVTLEDVLEEIVGDIQDEDAVETPPIERLGDGLFRVDGAYPLADLERDLGWEPEVEDADTVAGLVMERTGAIPRVGDAIEVDGWRVCVETMERTRIRTLQLERLLPVEEDERSSDRQS